MDNAYVVILIGAGIIGILRLCLDTHFGWKEFVVRMAYCAYGFAVAYSIFHK
jgi:uncharacterized membrane protein YuzA (DUF378 family)